MVKKSARKQLIYFLVKFMDVLGKYNKYIGLDRFK